jgi:mannosyltransferase OCH1-like enzyme
MDEHDSAVKQVHQILIGDKGSEGQPLPPTVAKNTDSIKLHHPNANYKLWRLREIRRFLSKHFSNIVLNSFDELNAYTAKADLARYCILYIEGGLYSDLSNRFLRPMAILSPKALGCFRDAEPYDGAPWATTPTILYAAPGLPELEAAIALLVDNVANRHYGLNPLFPTGPVLLGRALSMIGNSERYWSGEMAPLSGTYSNRNQSFFGPDGRLIAIRVQREGGNPAELGLRGTNNYNELWKERRYFSEGKTKITQRAPNSAPTILRSPLPWKGPRPPAFEPPLFKSAIDYTHSPNETPDRTDANPNEEATVIHQIIMEPESEATPQAQSNMQALRDLYPRARHKVLDAADLRQFIASHFDAAALAAFDVLPPGAYRSDFGRFCLLLVHGGLYINVDWQVLNPLRLPEGQILACFRAPAPKDSGVFWGVNTAAIHALPDQVEFSLALNLMIASVEAVASGSEKAVITGASALGRALAASYRPEQHRVGETLPLPLAVTNGAPESTPRFCLVSPDGTLIALGGG